MSKLILAIALAVVLAGCHSSSNPPASPSPPRPDKLESTRPNPASTVGSTPPPQPVVHSGESSNPGLLPEGEPSQSTVDKMRGVEVKTQDPEELRKEMKEKWGEAAPDS